LPPPLLMSSSLVLSLLSLSIPHAYTRSLCCLPAHSFRMNKPCALFGYFEYVSASHSLHSTDCGTATTTSGTCFPRVRYFLRFSSSTRSTWTYATCHERRFMYSSRQVLTLRWRQ
jgi:hypothetical protein